MTENGADTTGTETDDTAGGLGEADVDEIAAAVVDDMSSRWRSPATVDELARGLTVATSRWFGLMQSVMTLPLAWLGPPDPVAGDPGPTRKDQFSAIALFEQTYPPGTQVRLMVGELTSGAAVPEPLRITIPSANVELPGARPVDDAFEVSGLADTVQFVVDLKGVTPPQGPFSGAPTEVKGTVTVHVRQAGSAADSHWPQVGSGTITAMVKFGQ